MRIINLRSFKNSLSYAKEGIKYAYTHEQNFRIQVVCAVLVLILAYVMHISTKDLVIVLLLIGGVILMELVNTVLELFTNVIEPKIALYAKVMKDIMAGTVLIMSILAITIGLLIFVPYFT